MNSHSTKRAAYRRARSSVRNIALLPAPGQLGVWVTTQPRVHADSNPRIWLGSPRQVPARYQGEAKASQSLQTGLGTAVSVAADDFDQHAVGNLVVGYSPDGGRLAIHKFNLDAFAPHSQASFKVTSAGRLI